MLFTNSGDQTSEPRPTTFSGLDASGVRGQVADLNRDGLLDIVFAADPDNIGRGQTPDRHEDMVYWNTGLHGARENHWLRLRFSGVTDAELISARIEAGEPGDGRTDRHTRHTTKEIEVRLPAVGALRAGEASAGGCAGRAVERRNQCPPRLEGDRHLEVDLAMGRLCNALAR